MVWWEVGQDDVLAGEPRHQTAGRLLAGTALKVGTCRVWWFRAGQCLLPRERPDVLDRGRKAVTQLVQVIDLNLACNAM